LACHDIIDLPNTSASGFAPYVGDATGGTLTVMNGADVVASINLLGDYRGAAFQMEPDTTTGGGSGINIFLACFAAGTLISTERGKVAVEDLCIDDAVHVLGGRTEPVLWLGRRTVDCARHPVSHKVWPVRISAHAFGHRRPERDLWLSPDHAAYIDDVLVPVKYLVNDTTIVQVAVSRISYYHVELSRHSVLLADGLPVESYLDIGDRSNFTFGGGPITLFPDFASRIHDAAGFAPLVVAGPKLDAIRARLDLLAANQASGDAIRLTGSRRRDTYTSPAWRERSVRGAG
jgi:hypothetical protein